MSDSNPGSTLGRIHMEDVRDKQFPMSSIASKSKEAATEDRDWKYWWTSGYWGNQGNTPHCVGYAWTHFLADGHITQDSEIESNEPPTDPVMIYEKAQKLDQWDGENYAGTSVRGGVKALRDIGYVSEFRWAWRVETIIDAVLYSGPVVMGTRWYEDMYSPDEDNFVEPGGGVVGGHAYLLNGVNKEDEKFRIKNSWGREWGNEGFAWIRFEDLYDLLLDNGEACLATEQTID